MLQFTRIPYEKHPVSAVAVHIVDDDANIGESLALLPAHQWVLLQNIVDPPDKP